MKRRTPITQWDAFFCSCYNMIIPIIATYMFFDCHALGPNDTT